MIQKQNHNKQSKKGIKQRIIKRESNKKRINKHNQTNNQKAGRSGTSCRGVTF